MIPNLVRALPTRPGKLTAEQPRHPAPQVPVHRSAAIVRTKKRLPPASAIARWKAMSSSMAGRPCATAASNSRRRAVIACSRWRSWHGAAGDEGDDLLVDPVAEAGEEGMGTVAIQLFDKFRISSTGLPGVSAAIAGVRDPAVARQLAEQGMEVVGSTPSEFTALQAREYLRWKTLIEARKITAD